MSKTFAQRELLELLNREGVTLKYQSLRNYELQHLVTHPERGAGYGGKWAVYGLEAAAEAATAWRLMHGKYTVVAGLFGGSPPAIAAKAVAVARQAFLQREKEKQSSTEKHARDRGKATASETAEERQSRHIVEYLAYLYENEYRRILLLLRRRAVNRKH